jgi:hypothetical protein
MTSDFPGEIVHHDGRDQHERNLPGILLAESKD